ncbi:hypothetical protein G7Z17_g2575 [Cylindrodendrum hubeiense]|uniref:Amine oxidase n=1 Tax=Cylindrodendrum hubeiense TaxID=595255 RepID=A0A9P5HIM6_9HYPO|nr:hypothetical protein G7Z17_g2575 [Cylindrodendrum hubeiense]
MSLNISPIRSDVVVVGAGFAGLQAAVDVQKSGLSCVLLEATGRVGGKSLTHKLSSMDGTVELGPTWMNHKTQPRMLALAHKYGLELYEQVQGDLQVLQDVNGTLHHHKQGEFPESMDPKVVEALERIVAMMETEAAKFHPDKLGTWIDPKQPPNIPDISFEEFLRRNEVTGIAYGLMRWFSTGLFGVEPREIGMHYVLDMLRQGHGWTSISTDDENGAQFIKFKRGTTALCEAMANDLTPGSVVLDAPVVDISQYNDSCIIKVKDGRIFSCEKMILTNPAYTYTGISFNPPLPPIKRELAIKTRRGRYSKTVLTYRTGWWKDAGLLGIFVSFTNGPIGFTWDISRPEKGQYSLACFVCGDWYNDHFDKSPLEREQALLAHLAEMVPESKKSLVYDVAEYSEKDWYTPKYIEGAPMGVIGPGDWARLAPALRQTFRGVHFAGTDTASYWKGYMEGAVESGSRSACEVISLLKPRSRI